MEENTDRTRLLEGNIRRFILFRLFYTARFYYPVFTILFLDFGLSLEQFAILNLVWALTIVLAEVPSGALADIVGRKRLVVFAGLMMVIEMALIAFVPIGSSTFLFLMFLGNRICSGLSEAAASGADEALTYDSLKALGREGEWAHLLERTTRAVSIGFFLTMILGAFAYDSNFLNGLLSWINSDWVLSENIVIRLPIWLTLISACVVLITALGFYDLDKGQLSGQEGIEEAAASVTGIAVCIDPFRQIGKAAAWTLNHRFVLFVILAALALDSVARQFVVLAGEYYRIIDIPVSWFGFIGAGMGLLGIVNARIASYLVEYKSPIFNFLVLSSILLTGLIGILFAVPLFGVVFVIATFSTISMVQFQSSFYINRAVDSKIRATVLSFKGLALNLGLGIASLLYTFLVALVREQRESAYTGRDLDERVFVDSLPAFPAYFALLFIAIMVLGRLLISHRHVFFTLQGLEPGIPPGTAEVTD